MEKIFIVVVTTAKDVSDNLGKAITTKVLKGFNQKSAAENFMMRTLSNHLIDLDYTISDIGEMIGSTNHNTSYIDILPNGYHFVDVDNDYDEYTITMQETEVL